jgi:hypothetical protein
MSWGPGGDLGLSVEQGVKELQKKGGGEALRYKGTEALRGDVEG